MLTAFVFRIQDHYTQATKEYESFPSVVKHHIRDIVFEPFEEGIEFLIKVRVLRYLVSIPAVNYPQPAPGNKHRSYPIISEFDLPRGDGRGVIEKIILIGSDDD